MSKALFVTRHDISVFTAANGNKIGRAHVWTPVTATSRMPSSAWKKKKVNKEMI